MARRSSTPLCLVLAAFLAWPWASLGFAGSDGDTPVEPVSVAGPSRITRIQRSSPVESPAVATARVESDDEEGDGPPESPFSLAQIAISLEIRPLPVGGVLDPRIEPFRFVDPQQTRHLRC